MNWGKKTSAASTPDKGIMNPMAKMFSVSWFSKLKQRHGNKKSSAQGRKAIIGCPGSVSYGWNDEIELSPSTCGNCGAKCASGMVGKESVDISDNLRKAGGLHRQVGAKREPIRANRNLNVLRRDCKLEINLKCADMKMVGGKVVPGDPKIQNPTVKHITEVDSAKPIKANIRISCRSPSSSSYSQKHHHEASTHSKLHGKERENLREIKLAGQSLTACEESKSIYISRGSPGRRSMKGRSRKVRIYSPRTPSKAELCKIRALEDLKKARMKLRIKANEVKEKTFSESFAVVKCSFDPQKDFRNSMLEMILDKGLSQPEELEELLACYLILNSDEYHELIIKVFRQVWFDLNRDVIGPRIRGEEQCD